MYVWAKGGRGLHRLINPSHDTRHVQVGTLSFSPPLFSFFRLCAKIEGGQHLVASQRLGDRSNLLIAVVETDCLKCQRSTWLTEASTLNQVVD